MPLFNTYRTPCGCPESIEPINWTAQHDSADKIVDMLRVAFIDKDWAAGRVNTTLIHKLGIKASLPTAYEGQPDQTAFENWLSLLPRFFSIHQLDILNEAQDCTCLKILGQSLKEGVLTYLWQCYQKFLELGEAWDFHKAILDLCDCYL